MSTNALLRPIAQGVITDRPKIVRLPDGTLMAFGWRPRTVTARISRDNGNTWTEPDSLVSFDACPPGVEGIIEALVDRHGELQLFMVDAFKADSRGEAERGGPGAYHGYRIDIWHMSSAAGRTRWNEPHCIWKGYTGALNSVIQTQSGRIILPFSYYTPRNWNNRGGGVFDFSFAGFFDAVAVYSDDDGATWKLTNNLRIFVPDITYAYGACEPVVIELADGRVWMLIRGQTGRFWQSFSTDGGATWETPTPLDITSSDSPAGIVRIADGRIVLVWNQCLRHPYAYGGRQVLHAAISSDEGRTWRGYREVARDPHRNDPPPTSGDHGTAYPFPVATKDNAVIIASGQGEGRSILVRVDPGYLTATESHADFAAGIDDWSVFGTKGAELVPHPDRADAKALRIRRIDSTFTAGAVWNFPAGNAGTVRMRMKVEAGNEGLLVGLTDHFSPPFDPEDMLEAVYTTRLGSGGVPLSPGPLARCRPRLEQRPERLRGEGGRKENRHRASSSPHLRGELTSACVRRRRRPRRAA